MSFWAYMLHCADRTFYVGHTDELEKRIGQHERGLVPGYTSGRLPVRLVWSQEFATRDEARQAERQLKGWGRAKKLALIRGDWTLISALARVKKEGASTSSAKPVSVFLHPHPGHLPSESFSLEVVMRRSGDRLHLKYRLTGPLESVCIPPPAPPDRKDGLWRHSCFEAFMRSGRETGYTELNLSPSSEWAAYQFSAYRDGMAIIPATCRIRTRSDRYALEVSAAIDLPRDEKSLNFNLAAVIEEKNGTKSYWALKHPPGAPDFHHPDCFVLELPAPDVA
jgi:predicted GIY-YIG superfamily endonuclease